MGISKSCRCLLSQCGLAFLRGFLPHTAVEPPSREMAALGVHRQVDEQPLIAGFSYRCFVISTEQRSKRIGRIYPRCHAVRIVINTFDGRYISSAPADAMSSRVRDRL